MYGLVEVKVDIVRKAYRLLKNDDSIESDSKKTFFKTLKGMIASGEDSKVVEPYSLEQCIQIREILAEIVYASYISTSEHMMIKIEIASIIQDIIDMYEKRTVKVLNTVSKQSQEQINV